MDAAEIDRLLEAGDLKGALRTAAEGAADRVARTMPVLAPESGAEVGSLPLPQKRAVLRIALRLTVLELQKSIGDLR